MDKRPLSQLTHIEVVQELARSRQEFADYRHKTEQRILDMQGEIDALIECDVQQSVHKKNVAQRLNCATALPDRC